MDGSSIDRNSSTLKTLLRNLKHPATMDMDSLAFDEHQVLILLDFFRRYRCLYNTDTQRFNRALLDNVLTPLATPDFCYSGRKIAYSLPEVDITLADVNSLLAGFNRCSDDQLCGWSDVLDPCVRQALLGINLDMQNLDFIKPKIDTCMLCPDNPLHVTVTKYGGSGSNNGYCWAYHHRDGAITGIMCQAECLKCRTVYSLQTYTPGSSIIQRLGEKLNLKLIHHSRLFLYHYLRLMTLSL